MRNFLIISAGSCAELKEAIAKYWYCEEEEVKLLDTGEIKKNDRAMKRFVWRKLKGRYRFEALR